MNSLIKKILNISIPFDKFFNTNHKQLNEKNINNIAKSIEAISIDEPLMLKGDLEERYNYYLNFDNNLKSIHCTSNDILNRILESKSWLSCQKKLINLDTNNKRINRSLASISLHIENLTSDIDNLKGIIEEGLKIRHNTLIGFTGENEVNKVLDFCDDILTSHKGCRFKVLNQSNESDNLVVSPFGVFNIEVKNIGSYGKIILNIEKDGRWQKFRVDPYTGAKHPMEQSNITAQVTRQAILKQRLLNEELKKKGITDSIFIKSIIVIANENVDINNHTNDSIIRISQLYNSIVNNPKILSNTVMDELNSIIIENSLPAIKYDYVDINQSVFHILDKLNETIDLIESLIHELN